MSIKSTTFARTSQRSVRMGSTVGSNLDKEISNTSTMGMDRMEYGPNSQAFPGLDEINSNQEKRGDKTDRALGDLGNKISLQNAAMTDMNENMETLEMLQAGQLVFELAKFQQLKKGQEKIAIEADANMKKESKSIKKIKEDVLDKIDGFKPNPQSQKDFFDDIKDEVQDITDSIGQVNLEGDLPFIVNSVIAEQQDVPIITEFEQIKKDIVELTGKLEDRYFSPMELESRERKKDREKYGRFFTQTRKAMAEEKAARIEVKKDKEKGEKIRADLERKNKRLQKISLGNDKEILKEKTAKERNAKIKAKKGSKSLIKLIKGNPRAAAGVAGIAALMGLSMLAKFKSDEEKAAAEAEVVTAADVAIATGLTGVSVVAAQASTPGLKASNLQNAAEQQKLKLMEQKKLAKDAVTKSNKAVVKLTASEKTAQSVIRKAMATSAKKKLFLKYVTFKLGAASVIAATVNAIPLVGQAISFGVIMWALWDIYHLAVMFNDLFEQKKIDLMTGKPKEIHYKKSAGGNSAYLSQKEVTHFDTLDDNTKKFYLEGKSKEVTQASRQKMTQELKTKVIGTQPIPAISTQPIPAISTQPMPVIGTQPIPAISTQPIPAIISNSYTGNNKDKSFTVTGTTENGVVLTEEIIKRDAMNSANKQNNTEKEKSTVVVNEGSNVDQSIINNYPPVGNPSAIHLTTRVPTEGMITPGH